MPLPFQLPLNVNSLKTECCEHKLCHRQLHVQRHRMDEPTLKLKNAPIVEAILNIECDMPPAQDIATMQESAREAFRPQYPQFRSMLTMEHRIEAKPETQPELSVKNSVQGFQFLQEDGKQLVQMRAQGFSFNRLAPYSTLDDYIGEIERTWNVFVKVASPVQVRAIRLRYINRILLPTSGGKVELDDYFKICPHLPDEEKFVFAGFLNQHVAVEKATGNQVNIILAAQPLDNNKFPILFDITAASAITLDPGNWAGILAIIQSLRHLKNGVFRNTLTQACLNLFQQ
jgi:uncharacterized protein (TIGR04255 family)